jgi:hypothetical protein
VRRLIASGDQAFLAFIVKTSDEKEEEDIQRIPVVRDFLDVFSMDFSGLPPKREVEVRIECIPGQD